MIVLRLLLLALFAYLAWRLLRLLQAKLSAPPPPPRPAADFVPMQRCAVCGTYLPQRALSADGRCGRCQGQS